MITVEKLEKGTYFDDAFKISFRYDPTTVAKVKELAERRYLPEDRAWEIPAHELPALIEKVIDQLSLMSDKRRADIPRIAYNNISEDLFLMSKELKKPVLLMAQANREAVKNRKKGESPELHDLAESDGVGQNATRVLSLSVIDGTLKISIKKNRYGINNKEVLMIWEVNTGYLKPLLSENPEESTEDKKDDKPDGEHDKGGEKDYGF